MIKYSKQFMHLLIFIIGITAGITNAQTASEPNWVTLGTTAELLTISIDKASLKRNGDIVTVWESLVDKNENKSTRLLSEYNCKTNQTRTLSGTVYPSLNFTGRPSSAGSPQKDWSYVVRESISEDLMKYACKNAPKGVMDYFK